MGLIGRLYTTLQLTIKKKRMIDLDLKQGALPIIREQVFEGCENPIDMTEVVGYCNDTGKPVIADNSFLSKKVKYFPIFHIALESNQNPRFVLRKTQRKRRSSTIFWFFQSFLYLSYAAIKIE